MIRKYCTRFTIFTMILLAGNIVMAQAKPVVKPMAKFKPPVVKSMLGNITGSMGVAGVEEGKNLIGQPLKITDSKNTTYTLASYQFSYKRIGITEDEETGKTSPETDMVAGQFTETPLPAVWQSNIAETLHKEEILYFFDIIVIDKQGRRFFAPELKITIQ